MKKFILKTRINDFHLVAYFLLVSLLVIGSCKNAEKQWEEAKSKNTVEGYEMFISEYPESEFAQEALSVKAKLEEKNLWREVKSKNTNEGYELFLSKYPESQYKDSVNFLIEKIYFTECQNSDLITSYINFLKQYPNNHFTNEIKKLLEKKGTLVKLSKKKLVSIDEISLSRTDHCWIEYQELLKSESKDGQPKSRFVLWYKKDEVDTKAYKMAQFDGIIGKVLGSAWELKFYRQGQQMSFTQYDVYGRPKKTTRDRKSTRLNSSHTDISRMPSSA